MLARGGTQSGKIGYCWVSSGDQAWRYGTAIGTNLKRGFLKIGVHQNRRRREPREGGKEGIYERGRKKNIEGKNPPVQRRGRGTSSLASEGRKAANKNGRAGALGPCLEEEINR